MVRLGLALSGGGFRASFFHLGVLRRLAELDVLRFVTTISTVSGGSILGAHYYLHLKKRIETSTNRRLERDDYIAVVVELEKDFIRGNSADLRNRLFLDVFAHLRAMVLGRSYGRRMARLYAKHLYGPITRQLYGNELFAAEGVPLHQAVVVPGGTLPGSMPLSDRFLSTAYPGRSTSERPLRQLNTDPNRTTIPRLIINATCLNTGGPFVFTMNEVGGPAIGYIRTDEVFMLVQLKTLISECKTSDFKAETFAAATVRALERGQELMKEPTLAAMPQTAFQAPLGLPAHMQEHLRFYLAACERIRTGDESFRFLMWYRKSETSPAVKLLSSAAAWPAVRQLLECDFAKLRKAKVAAWYYLDYNSAATANRNGKTRESYRHEFGEALADVDSGFRRAPFFPSMAHLVLDFYYLRSADNIDWNAPAQLADLTLADAVAASANFPPVFTPFRIFSLFDTTRYDVLALTDGGVNDNQGVQALLADGCEYVIASDAGGLVEPDRDPADSRLPMMDRIINVLMGGLRDYQLLSAGATAVGSSSDPRKVHFHMTDELQDETGEAPRNAMARIRTDLDAFNDIEIQLLIRRGYLLAQQKVRPKVFHAKSPFRTLAKPTRNTPPAAPRMNDHVLRILRGSARQSGRLAEAYPVIAATLAMLTILLLVGEADRGVRPPLRRSQKVAEHEHRFTRIDRELHAARGRR